MSKVTGLCLVLALLVAVPASAKDRTHGSGKKVFVLIKRDMSPFAAEEACQDAAMVAKDQIRETAAKLTNYDFEKSLAVIPEVIVREPLPRRASFEFPSYECYLVVKNNDPGFTLRHAVFRQVQDGSCEPTFEQLLGSKNLIYKELDTGKTLFKHRDRCRAEYVELIKR